MKIISIFLTVFALSGCMSISYKETNAGKFVGDLDVRWNKNDHFIFIPNQNNPLKFIRKDGSEIKPEIMYTDGGSIPRVLWGVNGFSPWGYAPAYMIHDWLFEAQHCGHSPDKNYKFKDSVSIMAESLKTIMEEEPKVKNNFVFTSIVSAVSTSIAEKLWVKGKCKPVIYFNNDNKLIDNTELIDTIHF